jgi:alkaline phosphatase
LDYKIGEITSKRANLGWSTYGHSAVDVNLYAHGLNSEELAGNHENTEVGDFIVRQLGLDLKSVTTQLKGMHLAKVDPIVGDYRHGHSHNQL